MDYQRLVDAVFRLGADQYRSAVSLAVDFDTQEKATAYGRLVETHVGVKPEILQFRSDIWSVQYVPRVSGGYVPLVTATREAHLTPASDTGAFEWVWDAPSSIVTWSDGIKHTLPETLQAILDAIKDASTGALDYPRLSIELGPDALTVYCYYI